MTQCISTLIEMTFFRGTVMRALHGAPCRLSVRFGYGEPGAPYEQTTQNTQLPALVPLGHERYLFNLSPQEKSPTGPCQQAAENPILKSHMTQPLLIGPGRKSLIDANDQTWLFFHAWDVVGSTRGDARYMWLARMDWRDGKPAIEVP